MIEELFDIAHANATELIENEDKLFLESQRKKRRPGCMVGVDIVLLQQQQKKKEKEDQLQRRRCHSELEKETALKKIMLECSSGE